MANMSKSKTINWGSNQLMAFQGVETINIKNLKRDFKRMPVFKLPKKDR